MSSPASHAASRVEESLARAYGREDRDRQRERGCVMRHQGPPPAGDEPPPPPAPLNAISANYARLIAWKVNSLSCNSIIHLTRNIELLLDAPADSDMIVTLLAASGLLYVVGGLVNATSEHGRLLSRQKRYLTFPEGSAVTVKIYMFL